MEESDKTTALKKAYAEMILNTAKESAARVMISERRSAQIYHDLCGTKEESLRLLVRLKQMIDAKTIEAETTSSNQQQQIDVLEAQLQEAEDIITDLRSELRWVRDKLEKARTVVDKEQETTCVHAEVIVASLHPCNKNVADTCFSVTVSDSLPNQSSLHDDECGGNEEKQFDGLGVKTSKACDSELDANIRNKKLELSRNGSTQRIHALERKSCLSENEEEQCKSDKDSEQNLSSVNTRCLVLGLRSSNAEVITTKPSNALGIKKSRKLRGKRKRRWTKRKATRVRSQCQLIKPCQAQSDLPSSKTSMENSDGEDSMERHLSVENEDVDTLNAFKGLEEHLQHTADDIGIIRKGKRSKNIEDLYGISSPLNSTDHVVKARQESKLVSTKVEDCENKADTPKDETDLRLLPGLDLELTSDIGNVDPTSGSTNITVIAANETNRSTDKDLKSRKEDSVIPSTKSGSELIKPCSDSKAAAVVSDQISESPRADTIRLVKYTFQRKRKKRHLNDDDDNNHSPVKRKENNAEDSVESTIV